MDKMEGSNQRSILLSLSIILNVGLLAFFKYANFFVDNLNFFLESMGSNSFSWTKVILPIGISFYTFQTLTYSIDIYRKEHKPLDRVLDYMLYIIMFPQLIAGPIVRFNQIADQIIERIESLDDRIHGFCRFSIGLGKKVLIANVMGSKADEIMSMENFAQLDSLTAWLGILAYTFQIYFDFSGYSDMAIGLGRMMGFKFPENFNNPYISKSISEFWRRWHITLGNWMRDYLYIPLGGNKVRSSRRLYFNLWFVFLISGLWHGASWNFIIWGIYHGFFLVIERLFLKSILKRIGSWCSLAYCFFITVLGWVIFRIEDIDLAWQYYGRLFAFDLEQHLSISFGGRFWTIGVIAIFFSFFTLIPYFKRIHNAIFEEKHDLSKQIILWIISIIIFTMCIGSLSTKGFNPFIYFRF
jgi:alginate O-acetyltransferase complex protein AlgI